MPLKVFIFVFLPLCTIVPQSCINHWLSLRMNEINNEHVFHSPNCVLCNNFPYFNQLSFCKRKLLYQTTPVYLLEAYVHLLFTW